MKKIYPRFSIFFAVFALIFTACEPQQDTAIDLGNPPTEATFTIEETGEMNTFRLTNTTNGAFLFQWDLGNGSTANGEVVEVRYQSMGTYEVQLTAFNKAGSASGSSSITVNEDAPINCEDVMALVFLTNCDSKTWTLLNDEGALWVGPDLDGGTIWWQNPIDEIAARPCAWNDEWVFSSDDLTMTYDTKGDIWGEDYLGFNFECVPTGDLSAAVAAWGDGSHAFEIIPANDDHPVQLRVVGEGGFLGIPKAANGAEVGFPQASVIYDIIAMENDGTKDILTVAVNFGAGFWRFKLESN